MKLKKVTKNDPLERLAVSVRKSTLDMLGRYQSYYKKTYGEDIERSHLVEEILKEFMSSDKTFMKDFDEAERRDDPEQPRSAPVLGEGTSSSGQDNATSA